MANKAALAEYYNSSGAYIGQMASHDEAYFSSYLSLLQKFVTRPGALLDVGCGSGQSTSLIAGKFPEVRCTGVDISEHAIIQAKRSFGSSGIEFVAGDISRHELPEASFDYLTSYDCLEHIPELEKSMRGMMKLLKADGLFIIKGPNHMSPLYTMGDLVTLRHRYPFTLSWADNFRRLGFETGHFMKGLSGAVEFIGREPDLTDSVQVGNDADAVNDMSSISVANFFRREGWRVRQISWPRSSTAAGMAISRMLPYFGSMGIVAQKPA
jgi:ubiquinone/menaquinone biosynthesis C-methylase UbiE